MIDIYKEKKHGGLESYLGASNSRSIIDATIGTETLSLAFFSMCFHLEKEACMRRAPIGVALFLPKQWF